MRLRKLQKYRHKTIRAHLRGGIGDVTGTVRFLLPGGREYHGGGDCCLYTGFGDVTIECRVIKSVAVLKVKKPRAGW